MSNIGHNKGPVTAPEETDIVADLASRYPTAQSDLDEILAVAKDVPDTIKDEETAGKVQALLKKSAALKNQWKALRGVEKRPWKVVGDIIGTWFETKEEAAEKLIATIKPRHTAYLDAKAEAARLEEEAKAKKAREDAERAKFLADWAEAEVELAEWETAQARKREEEARAAEEKARKDQEEAERRAAEQERLAQEAQERLKARLAQEAERRKERKVELRRLTKESKGLALIDAAGAMTEEQRSRYQALIGRDGLIQTISAQLESERGMLSPEEIAELEADEKALAECRAERKANHDRAEAAALAAANASQQAREAGQEAKAHEKAGDRAERAAASAGRSAEKLDNRADRQELRAENLTDADASRTRGEGGSVGTLSGSWQQRVLDWDAPGLREALWDHVHQDAKDAAVTKWKMANQRDWHAKKGTGPGQGKVTGALPGVEFIWVPTSKIAG